MSGTGRGLESEVGGARPCECEVGLVEVRIGLGGPFGLVGRLPHRDRRRPRRGHRAVHQGQRRPPPGRRKIRQIRTCVCSLSPHPKFTLGRGLFCAGEGGPLGLGWQTRGRESGLKYLSFPSLCASRGLTPPHLPSPCACVYSSPSRRTPAGAAARTPRTGYCGRRRRSDRPFRTGFIRWLGEEEIPPQAPVFHEFLESIYLNFKVLFGRRVRSWLRTNAGGAPNTCKSRG